MAQEAMVYRAGRWGIPGQNGRRFIGLRPAPVAKSGATLLRRAALSVARRRCQPPTDETR